MKKNIEKNLVITIIEIILIVLVLFCIIKIIIWYINSKNDLNNNSELINNVVSIYENREKDDNDEKRIENKNLDVMIDFNKLYEINNDIIGWIKIENTNVNYPILRGIDNEYYLYRNFKKEYSQAGSIFLDMHNNSLNENNIILYGHNMQDGSMFSDLINIFNGRLGNEVNINIYMKDLNSKYKVVSTYIINPDEFSRKIDFKEILNKSKINFKFENVDKEKILMLYTCDITQNKRIIVVAAKI